LFLLVEFVIFFGFVSYKTRARLFSSVFDGVAFFFKLSCIVFDQIDHTFNTYRGKPWLFVAIGFVYNRNT
jgi:hypothetical protein